MDDFLKRLGAGARSTSIKGIYASDGPVAPELRRRFAALDLQESKRIEPVSSVDERMPRPQRRRRREGGDELRVSETSPGWAGCVYSGKWRSVTASWRVPGVGKGIDDPAGSDGRYWMYSWVGIDGWGENEVLQIGVAQRVDPDGTIDTYGWYEWLAAVTPESPPYVSPMRIDNFAVAHGDHVTASVEYLLDGAGNPYAGNIAIANTTNGQHFGVCLQPPPNTSMPGTMCEWVIEDPGGGYPDYSLALFTPTTFTSATCTSFDGATTGVVGDSQELVDITNVAGTKLTVIKSTPGTDSMDAAYYLYNID